MIDLSEEAFLLIISICIILSIVLIEIIFVIIYRIISTIVDVKNKNYYSKVEELLNELVFDDEQNYLSKAVKNYVEKRNIILKKFNNIEDTSNPNFRKAIKKLILKFHKNVDGAVSEELRKIYIALRLSKDSIIKISSNKWILKVEGIIELTQLNIKIPLSTLKILINHNNEIVRQEAIFAVVKFYNVFEKNEDNTYNDYNDVRFNLFGNLEYELSEWQQIKLINTISQIKFDVMPDFSKWLNSENKSVKVLFIKLIVHYNQYESIPILIKLLDEKDEKILKQTILALGELEGVLAVNKLIELYSVLNPEYRIDIIKSLGKIGTDNVVIFLIEKFSETIDDTVKLIILESIKTIDEKQIEIIKRQHNDEKTNLMIKHLYKNENLD